MNYSGKGENNVSLTGKKYLLSKTEINEQWKVAPIFKSKKSTSVDGIRIGHYDIPEERFYEENDERVEDRWKCLIDIPNYKDEDYYCNSKIGKLGYKYVGTEEREVKNSNMLLLFCKMEKEFSSQLEHNERLDVLDRLMKTISNTISDPFTFPDNDAYLARKIKDKYYDHYAIDEFLEGNSACHIMDPD